MLKGIRDFFHNRGYLEADTPLLAPAVIPEAHLDYFSSAYRPSRDSAPPPLYLLPSPELWLKRLLAQGSGPLFEISRAFRNCEQQGPHHNPEFTILEWYQTEGSPQDNIRAAQDLLTHLAHQLPEPPALFTHPPEIIPMAEAFRRFASINLAAETPRKELLDHCRRRNLQPDPDDTWEVLFNRIFLTLVEPSLPADRPCFVTSYPAQIPTLAQTASSGWAERWELYLGGIELANCYQEERDRERIGRFFREESALRKGDPHFPPAWESLADEMSRMPRCSGAALGVDRLIQAAAGESSLQGVILFPFPDILPHRNRIQDKNNTEDRKT